MAKSLIEGKDYTIVDGVLKINEGIEVIPSEEFHNCEDITKIILPSTLVSIGNRSFPSSLRMEKLVLPDSVKYIGEYAFGYSSIYNLVIGKNVTFIGKNAFFSVGIKKITNRSRNLRYIGECAFAGNRNINKFDYNNCSTYIHCDTFFDCVNIRFLNNNRVKMLNIYGNSDFACNINTTEQYSFQNGVLKIKDGVEIIDNFQGLENCTSIEMPDSVIVIDKNALSRLYQLKDISFSNNLLCIRDQAFAYTNFNDLVILPDSLSEVAANAFISTNSDVKVSIPMHTGISDSFRYNFDTFERRNYSIPCIHKKHVVNLDSLLSGDRAILKNKRLLPEDINNNRNEYQGISNEQSNIIAKAFKEFIMCDTYEEDKGIKFAKKLLDLKEIDVSNMRDVVNHLFDKKQIKTIYLLMNYGYDYMNNCMISKAIINDMTEMIEVLLILGVNINEIDEIGMTSLSVSCQKGDYNIAKYLIEKGAAINKVDKFNKKAIDYAIENNFQDIIDYINSFNNNESEVERDLRTIRMTLDK